MGGWRKRKDQSDVPSENGTEEQRPALIQAATRLSLSDTAAPAVAVEEAPAVVSEGAFTSVLQFCPECGGRMHASADYIPKFCALCGHRLAGAATAAPVSGLDALLAATAAAKASGGSRNDSAAPADNVTFLGASQTLMGVPRTHVHTRTLMGVSRTDLYGPPSPSVRTGASRARVQNARRAGTAPPRTRSLPPSATPTPEMPRTKPRQSNGPGPAISVFITLLLLAVCAAAVTFWLCRRGIIALPI